MVNTEPKRATLDEKENERGAFWSSDPPDDEPFGVYVHVPFCTKRCDYCAFAIWTDRFHLVDRYVQACVTEANDRQPPPATSVFFGGGTPSLLAPDQIAAILGAIPRRTGAEVTLECNPETLTLTQDGPVRRLAGYGQAGVTRLSFGVQSMQAPLLAALGRAHDPAAVPTAVAAAGQAGFADAYSVDLIYGAAGESVADWDRTLAAVLDLEPAPTHISAYALTVEAGTPLATQPDRHPDADDQAEKYLWCDEILQNAGLHWYEISNWASPGRECRHNQLYWEQGQYLGVGCAAHSHLIDRRSQAARRSWNIRSVDRYLRAVENGRLTTAGGEDLDLYQRAEEALQLRLRTHAGVPEAALPGWQEDPILSELVEPAGPGHVRLTAKGRLLANEVTLRLEPPETPSDGAG